MDQFPDVLATDQLFQIPARDPDETPQLHVYHEIILNRIWVAENQVVVVLARVVTWSMSTLEELEWYHNLVGSLVVILERKRK